MITITSSIALQCNSKVKHNSVLQIVLKYPGVLRSEAWAAKSWIILNFMAWCKNRNLLHSVNGTKCDKMYVICSVCLWQPQIFKKCLTMSSNDYAAYTMQNKGLIRIILI